MTEQVLFKFKEYVELWQTGTNAPNINGPMIQYYTKVYKGVTNTIDFVVRNNDRKPINLVGYQIEALIQRVENPELLLIKTVEITDDVNGKARLLLDINDINIWIEGYYRYSVRLTHVSGRQEYLNTDLNRSTFSSFELIEGMEVSLSPSIEILASKFTPCPIGDYGNTWQTSALQGNAQTNRLNGMNTVVAYTEKFIGRFWIQASISNNAPLENEWFNIQLRQSKYYFDYTSDYSPRIKVFNFTGNYNWVRMFFQEGLNQIMEFNPYDQTYSPPNPIGLPHDRRNRNDGDYLDEYDQQTGERNRGNFLYGRFLKIQFKN